jgi:hypothetical protein
VVLQPDKFAEVVSLRESRDELVLMLPYAAVEVIGHAGVKDAGFAREDVDGEDFHRRGFSHERKKSIREILRFADCAQNDNAWRRGRREERFFTSRTSFRMTTGGDGVQSEEARHGRRALLRMTAFWG